MNKKKVAVLHAQCPFMSGGAELMVKYLVKNLRDRDFDAELISIPFKWYPENTLYDSMLMWRMLDLSEANGQKIDLVIPTKFPTYGVDHPNKVTWLMHQHRFAYDLYYSEHGLSRQPNGETIKNTIQKFDTITLPNQSIYSISNTVSNRLKKHNNLDAICLYHPPALVGQYECEDYGDYIFSIGRLDPLKRNDLLIKALKYTDKKVKLKIAGTGKERENLERLVEQESLKDRVEFLGFVSDEQLIRLYANCFSVYFSPIDEDYGYITLEAFLSKKPVVTCEDSGGVLEFVRDGENGYVCDNTPEAIGQRINDLYHKRNKCKELGVSGFNLVKDISWNNVIDELTKSIR